MDTTKLRELLDQMDAVRQEIQKLTSETGIMPKERKMLTCSVCGGPHTARTCPTKNSEPAPALQVGPNGVYE